MYTIKQAAARSGVTVSTARAWERRYGVVHPQRTASGYRLYDDEAIGRLIAMRYLVETQGYRPSQAAEQVQAAGTDVAQLVDRARASAAPAAPPPTAAATRTPQLVDDFVAAAGELDVAAMERLLDEVFATQRFEAAVQHVVFPALRKVGERWSDGSLDVAMEHAASETIRRRLARFYDALASGGDPDVIVGLPPGGHHELGALVFAIAARRQGVEVVYLGADVPLPSWLIAAEATRAPIAVIGVIGASDVPSAAEVVAALRSSPRPPAIALGGPRAHEIGQLSAAVLLPAGVDDAVRATRGMLAQVP
jgi:DNA-binding transcriptional MerR regulator/methylmalonyl-CoA mutase cobalamin-binding subunit